SFTVNHHLDSLEWQPPRYMPWTDIYALNLTLQKHSIVKEQRLGGIVRQQLVHYFCPHLQYTIAHTRIQAHTY
ncbi:hypothetical protein MGG_16642, partial [Pyricularia oryzae 70-15]